MIYQNESKKFIARYGTPPSEGEFKDNKSYRKALLSFELPMMMLWDIPDDINKELPALPNRLYINKDMVKPLERAFRNLIAYYKSGKSPARDSLKTWDGCYQIRKVRGSATSPSRHCWAMAFDVNAAWNGLGKEPQLTKGFVECFTKEGFYWGGYFQRKDGMHFEYNINLLPKKT